MTHRESTFRRFGFVAACLLASAGALAAAPPDAAKDSANASAPRVEPLRPSARGAFDPARAEVGDTVEYRLRVSWRDAQASLRVLPPRDELRTPGLEVLGQSSLHRKTAGPDGVVNVTEFTYLLVAREPGRGRVAPFSLRYLDGVTGREQTLEVAGAALDISPARAPLTASPAFRVGALILALLVAAAAVAAARRKKPSAAPAPKESATARELRLLRERCGAADSRAWLADAERLCLDFLGRDLGLARTGQVRFEAALAQYLARHPGLEPAEVEGWTKLRDLFHEARFAGGLKPAHELREACRRLKTCLKLPGEET